MIYEQILVLLSCYFLLFTMYFIGSFLFSTSINGIGYIFTGYGFLYLLFLVSAIIKSNLLFYLCPLFFIFLYFFRFNYFSLSVFKIDLKVFLTAQILISPFLIYTFFLNNLNWDDYATWLPNSYYIFEYGHLPRSNMNSIDSAHPSYPYAFPILIGIINKIHGYFYENVAPMFNVIFLSFILILAIPNKKLNFSEIILRQIYAIPILLLAVLIMNTKGVFGAGPDLIICLLSCLYIYVDLINHNFKNNNPISLNYQELVFKCFIGISLVGTKQVGFYIFFIISLASFLIKLITNYFNNPRNNNTLNNLCYFLIPMLISGIIYYSWNFYAELEGLRLSFGSFSIENIRLHDFNKILLSIWSSTIEKPYVLITLLLNLYLYIRYKDNYFLIRYFTIISFVITAMIFCFLLLAYLTVFGEYEGNRAASFERYIAPAGFVSLISILFVLNKKDYEINLKKLKVYIYPLIIILVYIGISISENKRIIRKSSINYSELINFFKKNFQSKSHINIFDFHSLGYIGHILTFKLYGHFYIIRYDPLNYNLKYKKIDKYINQNINIFFGQFNDQTINSIITKPKFLKKDIINSKELNLWIVRVSK